jgi:hypothetical protein
VFVECLPPATAIASELAEIEWRGMMDREEMRSWVQARGDEKLIYF